MRKLGTITGRAVKMSRHSCAVLLAASALSPLASALTIDTINLSTVAGYGDTHYPVTYPGYDRFSILGAALSYTLSDGQVRESGAGWIPYTNGNLAEISVADNKISYRFDRVNNWAKGEGTIFYSVGQVWCSECNENGVGLWTEDQFAPVSPIVLTAEIGSKTATLDGTAKIIFNNSSRNWSLPENFVALSSPEGSIVRYSTTYTLTDNSTWNMDTFNRVFNYNMEGTINVSPVPEVGTQLMMAFGVGLLLLCGALRGRTSL